MLKAWREESGLAQSAAAKKIGVRQPTWCEWESGGRTPQLDHAIRIEVLSEGRCPIESWADDPEVARAMREALRRRAAELQPNAAA